MFDAQRELNKWQFDIRENNSRDVSLSSQKANKKRTLSPIVNPVFLFRS